MHENHMSLFHYEIKTLKYSFKTLVSRALPFVFALLFLNLIFSFYLSFEKTNFSYFVSWVAFLASFILGEIYQFYIFDLFNKEPNSLFERSSLNIFPLLKHYFIPASVYSVFIGVLFFAYVFVLYLIIQMYDPQVITNDLKNIFSLSNKESLNQFFSIALNFLYLFFVKYSWIGIFGAIVPSFVIGFFPLFKSKVIANYNRINFSFLFKNFFSLDNIKNIFRLDYVLDWMIFQATIMLFLFFMLLIFLLLAGVKNFIFVAIFVFFLYLIKFIEKGTYGLIYVYFYKIYNKEEK